MDYLDIVDVGLIGTLIVYELIAGLVGLFMLVCLCIIFNKAGEPWWAAIIPIYNIIVLLKISGKPWWWLLLFLIPIVNIVLMIVMYVGFVKNFGRSGAEALLLLFFSVIYLPYMAFSKNVQFTGSKAAA